MSVAMRNARNTTPVTNTLGVTISIADAPHKEDRIVIAAIHWTGLNGTSRTLTVTESATGDVVYTASVADSTEDDHFEDIPGPIVLSPENNVTIAVSGTSLTAGVLNVGYYYSRAAS